MFRIWGKIFENNHMLMDQTIEDTTDDTRTHKVFNSLNEMCDNWDLGKPIWLEKNVTEFKRLGKTRFYQDNFIEQVDFDYLEIHIIEED